MNNEVEAVCDSVSLELTTHETGRVLDKLPPDVVGQLRDNSGQIVLAGGFIRDVLAGEAPKDIDLFVSSSTKRIATKVANALASRPGRNLVTTENAHTITGMSPTPQIVYRWQFSHPSQVIDLFDFEVCKAAIWYDAVSSSWVSKIAPRFREDLRDRRLTYSPPVVSDHKTDSLLRVLKFYARGYEINYLSLAQILVDTFQGAGFDTELHSDDAIHAMLKRLDCKSDFTQLIRAKGSSK